MFFSPQSGRIYLVTAGRERIAGRANEEVKPGQSSGSFRAMYVAIPEQQSGIDTICDHIPRQRLETTMLTF